jgi:hypothetical protein
MKTYSSICNDFQYFVRSIKGHLIFFYDNYRINKETKMRTYSSICNDFQYFVRSTTGQLIFVFGTLAHHDDGEIGMRDSKFVFVFIFLIKRCLLARRYTPNSQYVGHSYHVFSEDQLSWRFFLLSYEVKFFYFFVYFPLFVWCTFNIFLPKINCVGDFVFMK